MTGVTRVGGNWLPPWRSAVCASDTPGPPAPPGPAGPSATGGANTVSGSGTDRSSAACAVVSVPSHGVPPAVAGDGAAGVAGADGGGVASRPRPVSRWSGMPIRSAASCSHCGGLSRNEVWFRSTRAGAGGGAGADSSRPYSSS